jgi:hypothetical protein
MELNPCGVIDCPDQTLFDDNDYLLVTVDLGLALPEGEYMEVPVSFTLAVLNEEARIMASGEAYFIASAKEWQTETQVVLSFKMLPSFTWRESGNLLRAEPNRRSYNVEADAALPAYYLLLVPDNLNELNRLILSVLPLKFSYQMTLTHQEQ